jgi:hypothetical protein
MKKHLFVVMALVAVAGAGLYALAADPPAENKAPPQDSKAAAEEPKGNTGEVAAQPSAGVDGNAEFNEPSRNPAEMYARMDPAFAKFVDLSFVAEGMAGPNASLLADVALGLAEGERVLVRTHRTGLTSEAMMAKVVKLAARSNDKMTLERIAKASTSLSKPQWAKLVTEAKEFAGVSRDGPMVALGKIDVSTVALMERVRQACDVAELTGQKEPLEGLKKQIASTEADAKVKGHVADLIDSTLKGLPEKPDDTGKLLEEFSAASRQHWITRPQDWGKKGVILFPSRPSESTSSLAVMSYATIRNPTSSELIYFVDGRRTTLRAGNKITYTIGTNSGNVRPASIRFENGRGIYKQYNVGDGSYHFHWTPNGLDLFRD